MSALLFTPVVELDPGLFRRAEHPYPGVSGTEDPAGWRDYWIRCLADAGISGLAPLPGTEHVPVDQLTDPDHLRAICQAELSRAEEGEGPDVSPSPLSGGLAIFVYGSLRVVPQCCSQLDTWTEWQAQLTEADDKWSQVWIGHPWLSVRGAGEHIEVSQLHETEDAPVIEFSLDRSECLAALNVARTELAALARRLEPVLEELIDPAHATTVAATLSGLRTP